MNGKNIRIVLRWVHISLALFVGAAFYSPLGSYEAYITATLWGLIPALALTGWYVETVVSYESFKAGKQESATVSGKDYVRISRARLCPFNC